MNCLNCLLAKNRLMVWDKMRRVETIHPSFRLVALWLFVVTTISSFSSYIWPIMHESALFLKIFGLFSVILLGIDTLFAMINPQSIRYFPETSEIILLLVWSLVVGIVGWACGYGQISSLSFVLMATVFVYGVVKDVAP